MPRANDGAMVASGKLALVWNVTARPQATMAPWCPRKTDSLGNKPTENFARSQSDFHLHIYQSAWNNWTPRNSVLTTFPKMYKNSYFYGSPKKSDTLFYEDLHIYTIIFVTRVTVVLMVNMVTMFLRLMWPLRFLRLYIGPPNVLRSTTLCISQLVFNCIRKFVPCIKL